VGVERIWLPFSLAVVAASALAQPPGDDLGRRVDDVARQTLATPAAGMSIVVARGNQVLVSRGYGLANLEHSAATTPETVYHIDSISKNVLATVVLQLMEQGRLGLDDDVTKYVPEAPTQGRRVTIRELLNHTSGLIDVTDLPKWAPMERLEPTHAEVLAMMRDQPFDFAPGSAWRYDNSGYYLAGMVVERVTRQDYGDYLRERVFQPLGMTTASLCGTRSIVPHRASGYEAERGTLVNAPSWGWVAPFAAGGVCASASDLLKWQRALQGGHVINTASLALMRTATLLPDGSQIDYGLGTRMGALDGHRVVGHTGTGGGFNSVLEYLADDDVTIIVLTNTEHSGALLVATQVARIVLRLPSGAGRDLDVPQDELAAIPGDYVSGEGRVTVFAKRDRLYFRPEGSGEDRALARVGAYAYSWGPEQTVRFLSSTRAVRWAVSYTGGLMMDASRRVQ